MLNYARVDLPIVSPTHIYYHENGIRMDLTISLLLNLFIYWYFEVKCLDFKSWLVLDFSFYCRLKSKAFLYLLKGAPIGWLQRYANIWIFNIIICFMKSLKIVSFIFIFYSVLWCFKYTVCIQTIHKVHYFFVSRQSHIP